MRSYLTVCSYHPLFYQTDILIVCSVSALVELKQQYTNPPGNGNLTAARYIVPIPGNAAVCAFKLEDSDGRILAGVVKETEKAKKDFEKAVSKGKWSGLAYEITGDGESNSYSEDHRSSSESA